MKNLSRASNTVLAVLIAGFSLLLAMPVRAAELVLYTASNPEIEKKIMEAFKKKHPEITIKAVNGSTGPMTERAIAEKANPQADVIWMINTIALEQLKAAGALEPYDPKGSKIGPEFRDPDGFWVAHNATVMGLAVNTKKLKEKNLPMPVTWEDLIKPIYKGQITIAAPTKSGTGLSIMSTLVDAFGWNFIDNLHQNIFQYNESGSAAARQAGRGETVIGLSYDTALIQQVRAGVGVDMVIGRISPNVLEGAGLLVGAPHAKEGKVFLDWLFSEEAAKVFDPYVGATAVPGYGSVDMKKVYLWKMRRPLDANEFKRQWAAKYEGKK
jgi:iron(III) transport system substrate-binding protein